MKGFLYGQTEYNLLKNSTRLTDYVAKGENEHFDFLSITDSNMYAAFKFYKACKDANIKPILGLEYTFKNEDNLTSCVLLYAKNNEGYKELVKISSLVKIEGIDTLDSIVQYKNIYFVFPFLDSFLERVFIKRDMDPSSLHILLEYINKIKEMNGYIGISMTNKLEKIPLVRAFIEYIKTLQVSYLPIHQMKYLEPMDSMVYECLAKIDGKEDKISEYDDYSFLVNPATSRELDEFVSSINLNLFEHKALLPHYPNTKGKSAQEYLYYLCHKGLEKRGFYREPYIERLNYELSIIHKMGFDDYFLIVWDFICYSKKNHILVGPGRGSAVGSLVAYTLGITEINPLEYGLLFERFLNPGRITMPDIDCDFPDKDRDKVIDYVSDLYGKKHVCTITTFGTFQVKSSINELSKIFGINLERAKKISDMISERGYDELLKLYKDDELYNFLYCAKGIEGLPKHISTHASGIILSEEELDCIIPLSFGASNIYQSQFEAVDLEELGLLKIDFLVLSNLTLIDGMIHDIPNYSIEQFRKMPLDDKLVYKLFQSGDTLGIFQMEKPAFQKALRECMPTEFNDLVAMNALFRPGPIKSLPDYIRRKHGERFEYIHKDLAPILKETYGVIVYQEQIMQIAQKFAGYTLGEADILRRAVSKKKADVLLEMRMDFVKKSIGRGYSKEIAERIYELIELFANYGFNKSHSVAYALFAYKMAYLKVHHFNAFMANIMNHAISNKETLIKYIAYSKQRGLFVQKPNINVSKGEFVFLDNWLYLPIKAIKGIGEDTVLKITEERNKNGLFRNFNDFIERCKPTRSILEALVYSGALDVLGKTKKSMLEESDKQYQIYLKYIKGSEVSVSEYDFDFLKEKEMEYLGMNIQYNLFQNMKELYTKYKSYSLSDLKPKVYMNVIAAFSDLREITTKKGERMVLGMLEDDARNIKFTIFPRIYEKLPYGVLVKNKLYVLRGILEEDNKKELSFSISNVAIASV